MIDCVWCVMAHCDCHDYANCIFYMPQDNERAENLLRQYWADVESALAPVWAEYDIIRKNSVKEVD